MRCCMRVFIKNGERQEDKNPSANVDYQIGNKISYRENRKKAYERCYTKYLDLIDWMEMRKVITSLGEYKGLILVDVKASDGTEVLIQI